MTEWQAALLFMVLSGIVGYSLIVAAQLVRVRARKDSPLKRLTYESGEEAHGPAWIQFHPRYYVVALFFILFDLEAAFLLPWALILRELGALAIAAMVLFIGVLMLGWWYAVRKEALRWQ